MHEIGSRGPLTHGPGFDRSEMATGVQETLYNHPDVKQLPYGHGRDYSKGFTSETTDDKIKKVRSGSASSGGSLLAP